MRALKSWWALLVREYLEHRMAFVYFPLGIVVLMALSAVSGLGFNKIRFLSGPVLPSGLKIFELGYLVLLAVWFAYLAVTLFFYFGDTFAADRRNNAMLFWKSMPVSDFKILAAKFLAGITLFPAIIIVIAAVTGLMHFLLVSAAGFVMPALVPPPPLTALQSFVQITAFGIAYFALSLLWYAPFLAWVGGLSTVFGRWSLPLAFVIPGLFGVAENIALFGNGGPRGGYVWSFLSQRLQYGLPERDLTRIMLSPSFDAGWTLQDLLAATDWTSLGLGLVFAAIVLWLASEYRRRRIA